MNSDEDEGEGGRRTAARRARDDLRETMVQAGMELLNEHGLTLTYESISYKKVFAYLEREYSIRVTRGSVHERIWADQDEFRTAVLTEAVRFFPPSSLNQGLLRRAQASGKVDQFAKDVGSLTVPKIFDSLPFAQFQSAKALSSRLDDTDATTTIHTQFDERSEKSLAASRVLIPQVIAALGLQPKIHLGLSDGEASNVLSVLITGLIEGTHLDYLSGGLDATEPMTFRSEPAESDNPWRPVSVAIKSFLDFLFEPIDDGVAATPAAGVDVDLPVAVMTDGIVEVDRGSSSSRRSREQLRKLVLTAAVELLLQDGLQLVPECLGYSSVLAHLEQTRGITINRASFHRRIWETNRDYRSEVLRRSIVADAAGLPLNAEMLAELPAVRRPDGSVDRPRTKDKLAQAFGLAIEIDGVHARARRRFLQVKATTLLEPIDSTAMAELRAAVRASDLARIERNRLTNRKLFPKLGYRPRPELGLTEEEAHYLLSLLVMTTTTGLSLNRLAGITAASRPFTIATEPGDEPTEWTPIGLGVLAIFNQLYEVHDAA